GDRGNGAPAAARAGAARAAAAARAGARGADRRAALLEAVGGAGGLGLGLGAVELGLELARVLAALDCEADLLAGGDLVGHGLQERVEVGITRRVELLDG